MVTHNKRYIVWFWLLNLLLAWFGTIALSQQAHAILDHSLVSTAWSMASTIAVIFELLARPEFGPPMAAVACRRR